MTNCCKFAPGDLVKVAYSINTDEYNIGTIGIITTNYQEKDNKYYDVMICGRTKYHYLIWEGDLEKVKVEHHRKEDEE